MPEAKLLDGFVSLVDGMHGLLDPALLRPTQYAMGVNVSSRGGKIHSRPSLTQAPITDARFTTGKFQGAQMYLLNDQERMIVAVGGSVLGINMENFGIIDYTNLAGQTMDANVERMYFVQAEKFMIVQDGISIPLIIDGETARIADHTDPDPLQREVPIGTIMAYGHGRLFVAVSRIWDAAAGQWNEDLGRRFFLAGDIMLPRDVETLLTFSETQYLSLGGAFSLPNELGFINGMGFMRNSQTGTGLGPLIVFARNGASAFAVDNTDRASWETTNLSSVLFSGAGTGTRSPHSLIPVNNDLLYRGKEGIRSVGYSAATISSQYANMTNNPFSVEVTPIFDFDTDEDLFYSSLAYADNRVFALAKGSFNDSDEHIFDAMISMDLSVISSYASTPRPIFDGIWTGLDMTQVLSAVYQGKKRPMILAKDGDLNTLYYLDESTIVDGVDSRTKSRVYTRSMSFQQSIDHTMKRLGYCELWLSDIQGQVDIQVYYRPHGYALWQSFRPHTFCATTDIPNGIMPQIRTKVRFDPIDGCDTVLKQSLLNASEFQFCIQWTGHCQIDKAIFFIDKVENPKQDSCEFSSDCSQLLASGENGIQLDDYDYEI